MWANLGVELNVFVYFYDDSGYKWLVERRKLDELTSYSDQHLPLLHSFSERVLSSFKCYGSPTKEIPSSQPIPVLSSLLIFLYPDEFKGYCWSNFIASIGDILAQASSYAATSHWLLATNYHHKTQQLFPLGGLCATDLKDLAATIDRIDWILIENVPFAICSTGRILLVSLIAPRTFLLLFCLKFCTKPFSFVLGKRFSHWYASAFLWLWR